MLSAINISYINNMLNKLLVNDEFEVMFYNYKQDNKLSIVKFMNVLKYLKWRSVDEKLTIKNSIILDIIFNYEATNLYRISINGITEINKFLNLIHQRTNHIILSILLTQSEFINNPNFTYIKKIKDVKNIHDIDAYDIRIRKSTEEPLVEKDLKSILNLGLSSASKISFRFKNRISLYLLDDVNQNLSIDITTIQTSNNVNEIYTSPKTYELELDYGIKKDKIKNIDTISDRIQKEVILIKKVLENTNNILSKDDIKLVVDNYKKLVYFNDMNNNTLYSMHPISVEVQHIVDKIPNKYSVTDKADGENVSIFIFNKIIYIISSNLNITKTNYKSSLNNSIFEGELIYLNNNKYLCMMYDCLYYNGTDIRNESKLKNRQKYINDFCNDLNINVYEIKSDKYEKEVENFYNNIDKLIKKSDEIIFHPKIFLFPTGVDNSEVFNFAYIIWNFCTNNKLCPYKLDGIIFTGVEQMYTRDKREQKYPIYKYKPPTTNSIDVFITFQKNIGIKGYNDVFDNTITPNQVYRITNIYVYDLIGGKEIPIPFMKEELNHEAYFPLINGSVRDIDGNFVQDSTVVEIVYNNNIAIPHQYRWTILRTRWDKTESVVRYQKKYGNFKDVAIKIWYSIKEAILIDDIKNLGDPNTYPKQQKILQSKITSSVITAEREQDIYYQKISNLAKNMRAYHNWVKTILITTYCSPNNNERKSVLDIGCGQGGDLMKWYHARVGYYVGIDADYNGIYSSTNGAISRYNEFKKKFPGFGKTVWIHADASVKLDVKSQEQKIPNMTPQNKTLIEKTFLKNTKFDIISSQFALHYLFESTETVNNLIDNIKNYLKTGGYIILTLFDAQMVMNKFQDKEIYTSYYTDDDGKKNKLYEIIKKFDGPLKDDAGQPIDVYMSWIMNENKYEQEYLVTPKLLNKTMEKAGCRLVETDLFSNLYNINQQFFEIVAPTEENPKNLQVFKNVAVYYEDLKGIDKECRNYTFLNRYYIYQKIN